MAYFTDMAFIGLSKIIITFTYLKTIRYDFSHLPLKAKAQLATNLTTIDLPLTCVLTILYFSTLLYTTNGKTFGKIIFNLKIQNKNNLDLTFIQCFLRANGYLALNVFYFIPYALYLFNSHFLGLPDFFSSTKCHEEKIGEVENAPNLFQKNKDQYSSIADYRFEEKKSAAAQIFYLPYVDVKKGQDEAA